MGLLGSGLESRFCHSFIQLLSLSTSGGPGARDRAARELPQQLKVER